MDLHPEIRCGEVVVSDDVYILPLTDGKWHARAAVCGKAMERARAESSDACFSIVAYEVMGAVLAIQSGTPRTSRESSAGSTGT